MTGFFVFTNSADTGSGLTGFTVVFVIVAVVGTSTTGATTLVFKANQYVCPVGVAEPSH